MKNNIAILKPGLYQSFSFGSISLLTSLDHVKALIFVYPPISLSKNFGYIKKLLAFFRTHFKTYLFYSLDNTFEWIEKDN